MKSWQLSVNAAFFGLQRDRYTSYQPQRTLEEKLELIGQLEGVAGVELKYPFDLENVKRTKRLLEERGLALSAVNVDTKDAKLFPYGALSSAQDASRAAAVRRLQEGMDIAAEMGTDVVTTCPLADCYGYSFQIDYVSAWERMVDTVRQVGSYRSDVQFVLEYQPHDLQAHPLLNNVGKMLHLCAEVDLPNVGANLDIGHSIAAGENPAEAAALLGSKGWLRYIHTNDNTGDGGDWDMISGSVHLWHWLELLVTLERIDYDGWLGADIIPQRMDPVVAFQTNVRMLQRMTAFLERVGAERLVELAGQDGRTAKVYELLSAELLG
jgi:xylose isomerase